MFLDDRYKLVPVTLVLTEQQFGCPAHLFKEMAHPARTRRNLGEVQSAVRERQNIAELELRLPPPYRKFFASKDVYPLAFAQRALYAPSRSFPSHAGRTVPGAAIFATAAFIFFKKSRDTLYQTLKTKCTDCHRRSVRIQNTGTRCTS